MKVKVSEAMGPVLDWMMGMCEGGTELAFDGITWNFNLHGRLMVLASGWRTMRYSPSTNPAQSWPLIDREKIDILKIRIEGCGWRAYRTPGHEAKNHTFAEGPTSLIAAMRCYVVSKWGDEIVVAKDIRRGVLEGKPVSPTKRKPRPWRVIRMWLGHEFEVHRGATKEACEAWIEKQSRNYWVPRNARLDEHEQAKTRRLKEVSKYVIKPPKGA